MNYEDMGPRWAFHDDTAHAVLYQYVGGQPVRSSRSTLCGLSHLSTSPFPAKGTCDTCLERLGFLNGITVKEEAKV